jgi:hypothetical protein
MKRPLPRWGKLVVGGVLLGVAATAGTISLVLNVSHGLEAGLASGITFGLADIGKIIIPVVAGVVGWSGQLRVTTVVCVAVSLWCAVNYYADHHGRDLLAKDHGTSIYADTAKQIAELEAQAASLRSLAQQEGARKGCKRICQTLLAQAENAAKRLREARAAKVAIKPVEISGLAVMAAMASGSQAEAIARGIGAVKAALFLALVEVLVWLSVPAMTLLYDATCVATASDSGPAAGVTVAKRVAAVAAPVVAKSAPATAKQLAPPAKVSRGSREYYLQRLQREFPRLAEQVAVGAMSVFAASVMAGLRKPALA